METNKQDKIREVNGVSVNVDELVRQSGNDEKEMARLLRAATGISDAESMRLAGLAFQNRGIATPVATATKNRKTNKTILLTFFVAVFAIPALFFLIKNITGISASEINKMNSVSSSDMESYLNGCGIKPDTVTVENFASGQFIVRLHFVLGSIWDEEHGLLSMNIDSLSTFEVFQEINNVSQVNIVWFADLVDAYGNEHQEIALAVSMDKSTIDYCNFDNLSFDDLSIVSDDYILHPAFL